MRSHVRAQQVHQALTAATVAKSKGSQRTRGNRRLVMTSEPQLLMNARMVPVGVAVTVRLYEKGREVEVDPVRNIVNPPMMVAVTGASPAADGGSDFTEDPVAALWDALWDSVTDFPNPAGWRP